MSLNIARGTVEYYLQELQEALAEGFGAGDYTFDDAVKAAGEVGVLPFLEDYLYAVKADREESDE